MWQNFAVVDRIKCLVASDVIASLLHCTSLLHYLCMVIRSGPTYPGLAKGGCGLNHGTPFLRGCFPTVARFHTLRIAWTGIPGALKALLSLPTLPLEWNPTGAAFAFLKDWAPISAAPNPSSPA